MLYDATINFSTRQMKPSIALQSHREAIRNVVANHRAKNPRVFGSVLHGDDRDESDLDILVDPLPGATLFDLGAIQVELKELLGVSVDVLTPGDLPVKFRELVMREALPV
jgi:predicted nucleotidyltransferase